MQDWAERAVRASRYAVLLVLLGLVWACGGGGGGGDSAGNGTGQVPVQPVQDLNYFPMQAGDRWVYGPRADLRSTVVHVVGPDSAKGPGGMRLRRVNYDETRPLGQSESILLTSAGTVTEFGADAIPDPISAALGGVPLFRAGLGIGDTFVTVEKTLDNVVDVDRDGKLDRLHFHSEVTVIGIQNVSVPAGSFVGCLHLRNTLTLTVTLSSDGRQLRAVTVNDVWRAPGIGVVREDTSTTGDGLESPSTALLLDYGVGGRRSESVPPRVTALEPAPDSMLPSTFPVVISLSEQLDPESARNSFKVLDSQGRGVEGEIGFGRVNGPQLSFTPREHLATGSYRARLDGDVVDPAGNRLGATLEWRFDVDATAPLVASMEPADGAAQVPIDAVITVRFSEMLAPESVPAAVSLEIGNVAGSSVTSDVTVQGNVVTLRPRLPLARGQLYSVRLGSSIRDLQYNFLAPTQFQFTTAPGRFAAPESAADQALSMAIADFNGDGRSDIVYLRSVIENGTPRWALFLRHQNADGSMGTAADTGWRTERLIGSSICLPEQPVVGDFNGDGRIDVAVANGPCGIHILLQGIDGRLRPGQVLQGAEQNFMAAGDFNADGRMDLVRVADAQHVDVWLQAADGTLVQTPRIESGVVGTLTGGRVELADINRDGRLDLVFLTTLDGRAGTTVVVLLQLASGGLASPELFSVSGSDVTIGDVNGDGLPDIVVVSPDGDSPRLSWLLQQPSGRFSAVQSLPVEKSPRRARVADIDGDGRADVVVAHSGGFGLGLLRQQADGSLGPEEIYLMGESGAATLATGDLNGDGLPDVVVGSILLRQLPRAAAVSESSLPLRTFRRVSAPQRAGR